MKHLARHLCNFIDQRIDGTMLMRLILFGTTVFGPLFVQHVSAANRLLIDQVLTNQMVDVRINGKDSIAAITATITKNTDEDIAVVIPPGTYFGPEHKLEAGSYWSCDEITVPFLTSNQSTLDIPVVKYVLQPGSVGTNTELHVLSPPTDKIPRVLDFMVKNGMSHEAKQVAVGIIQNPNLTRDEIDSMYYTSYNNLWTEESVEAEDPIQAFVALKNINVPLDVFKLYTEQVSLVHGLGSQDNAVRKFALSSLVELGALDKRANASLDYRGALMSFLKSSNRSVRYRAVLALQHDPGADVVRALLPFLTDEHTVYFFPSAIMLHSNSRTIHGAVMKTLKRVREEHEDILLPLLKSADYKARLAGIEIFQRSQKEGVKALLKRLKNSDEYKQVREAAAKALSENK